MRTLAYNPTSSCSQSFTLFPPNTVSSKVGGVGISGSFALSKEILCCSASIVRSSGFSRDHRDAWTLAGLNPTGRIKRGQTTRIKPEGSPHAGYIARRVDRASRARVTFILAKIRSGSDHPLSPTSP